MDLRNQDLFTDLSTIAFQQRSLPPWLSTSRTADGMSIAVSASVISQKWKSAMIIDDLFTLRLFVRAAELGTLGAAADHLNIAIAAASRRIKQLEDRMGVRLFRRSRQGLVLTAAGSALLDRARNLLDDARSIESTMSDFAGGMRGAIRLQANLSAIAQFLPADLARFSSAWPDLRIELEERLSSEIVAAVTAGEADVGVVVADGPIDLLSTVDYRSDQLALVVPKGEFGYRTSIAFADVPPHDFVGLVNDTALTRTLMREAARADYSFRLRMQVRSFDGMCRMVEAGFGYGVLPLVAAQSLAGSMQIDVLAIDDPWAHRRMKICALPANAQQPAITQLFNALGNCARAGNASGASDPASA
ncbi:LysR family transcriptional regulator [Sphingomonas sp. BGYR3]|uniref:LysR family transcriptional regulator n=1 Tax=Sphingomonas sp. BGYR3 TaxID=2975483 RepID=UPI0021A426D9|nr:LysR family transcriptional regulator [Sphingomonas sp. BGYR3]MDG5487796.1 LysR family transcriptional regulator [Sphingomonas sp. BGYR3]